VKFLSNWLTKRKKMSQEKAISRLMDLSREMRRVKLDHYGNWPSNPQFIKASEEFNKLSEQVKEENGSR
jgi:glutaredoxin-related protein